MDEEESFFDLVTRFQSKRMDDQRCSLAVVDNKENQQASTLPSGIHGEEYLLDGQSMIVGRHGTLIYYLFSLLLIDFCVYLLAFFDFCL